MVLSGIGKKTFVNETSIGEIVYVNYHHFENALLDYI